MYIYIYIAFINNVDRPNRFSFDGHPSTSKFRNRINIFLQELSNSYVNFIQFFLEIIVSFYCKLQNFLIKK